MREVAEFRVRRDVAHVLFDDTEGVAKSLVRVVEIATSDPRYERVGQIQRELLSNGERPFFYGWHMRREYAPTELRSAKLFLTLWSAVFEPAGEEGGTLYDDARACTGCGAGAPQMSPLILDGRTIPLKKDFATTIAGELIVSSRAKAVLEAAGVTDIILNKVRYRGVRPRQEQWYQLTPGTRTVELTDPTKAGNGPFDSDPSNQHRCPLGHVVGLNLLSEATVAGPVSDVMFTRQQIGVRRGLLRPSRLVLVAPRVRTLIMDAGLKGLDFEVAHLA